MTSITQWKLTRLENNGARIWRLQFDGVSADLTSAQLRDSLRCCQAVFKQTERFIQPMRRRRDWYSAIDSLMAAVRAEKAARRAE
jgi:hypothetical protein